MRLVQLEYIDNNGYGEVEDFIYDLSNIDSLEDIGNSIHYFRNLGYTVELIEVCNNNEEE